LAIEVEPLKTSSRAAKKIVTFRITDIACLVVGYGLRANGTASAWGRWAPSREAGPRSMFPVIDTWRGEFRAVKMFIQILIIGPLMQIKLPPHFAQIGPGNPPSRVETVRAVRPYRFVDRDKLLQSPRSAVADGGSLVRKHKLEELLWGSVLIRQRRVLLSIRLRAAEGAH
jgi:hypothetical protein